MCQGSNVVLVGAVGGSKWDDPKAKVYLEDISIALKMED